MASDLLLGFIIGIVLVGCFLPMKGILFIILEQRKQIAFLREGDNEEQPDFPNRKEES